MHGTVPFGTCLCAVQKLLTTKKSFFGRLFGALLSRPRRPLLLRLRWRLVVAVAVVLVRRVVVLVVVAHQALLDDGAPPWNSNSASASAGSPIARRTTGLLRSPHRGRHGLKLMQDAQQGSSPASCWADSRAQQRFQRPERQTGQDKKKSLVRGVGSDQVKWQHMHSSAAGVAQPLRSSPPTIPGATRRELAPQWAPSGVIYARQNR